nr:immunoglobulin light chain junction region [Macaca mulatta]MOV84495.1 immunoglobulin light chain junction region [Macaca mulatta]MOV86443.1 immunoglobulin light chain junction region [Macaca mulatta]MOV86537.1 immunoglobulin light chain junction region [Macaca mulatta]
CQQGYGFPWTF